MRSEKQISSWPRNTRGCPRAGKSTSCCCTPRNDGQERTRTSFLLLVRDKLSVEIRFQPTQMYFFRARYDAAFRVTNCTSSRSAPLSTYFGDFYHFFFLSFFLMTFLIFFEQYKYTCRTLEKQFLVQRRIPVVAQRCHTKTVDKQMVNIAHEKMSRIFWLRS